MPKERQPAYDTHQVNEQDSMKVDIAAALAGLRIHFLHERGDLKLIEEPEELIEHFSIAEPVNFFEIIAVRDAFCDT